MYRHELPKWCHQVLDDCLKTADAYASTSKQNTEIKKPSWMRWKQDCKDLKTLNKKALDLAIRLVENGILPSSRSSPLRMSSRVGDLEKLAWEILDGAMPQQGAVTWGTVAGAQLQALVSLSRAMPTGGDADRRKRKLELE